MYILKAELQHVHDLIPLLDGYRMFYRQTSDFVGAKKFLEERLKLNESIIYMAYEEENAIGFVQLFPIFSSVSMQRMYLLNDLYVEKNYRGQGVGKALINKAKELCREENLYPDRIPDVGRGTRKRRSGDGFGGRYGF